MKSLKLAVIAIAMFFEVVYLMSVMEFGLQSGFKVQSDMKIRHDNAV